MKLPEPNIDWREALRLAAELTPPAAPEPRPRASLDVNALLAAVITGGVVFNEISAPWLLLSAVFYLLSLAQTLRNGK